MANWTKVVVAILVLCLAAGCSRPVVRSAALPSKAKDQYLRLKRAAVFPFENYSETKDADRTIDALLITALREQDVFDEVEDTRFVRDVMKKLKITATDVLDKEVVKKLGDEMNVQAVIYGKIVNFGKGKEKEAGSQMTMDLALVDPASGSVLWNGNVSAYGGLTVGKVFGITEGLTDIDVARTAVRNLAGELASDIRSARAKERKGVIAGIRKEEEAEKAKLDKLKGETGKLQGEIDKAKSEAQAIKTKASKDAEAVKAELELQKAAVDAEKAKTEAAQQAIDKDKLKVEMERKKIDEDLKKVDTERKKLEADQQKAREEAEKAKASAEKAKEAVKEEAVKESAPAVPAPAPAPEPAPAPAPAPVPAPAPQPGT